MNESRIVTGFHIPGTREADSVALDVAAVILGQGDSARLNLSVKRNQSLVSDVYAYAYTPRDPDLQA